MNTRLGVTLFNQLKCTHVMVHVTKFEGFNLHLPHWQPAVTLTHQPVCLYFRTCQVAIDTCRMWCGLFASACVAIKPFETKPFDACDAHCQ